METSEKPKVLIVDDNPANLTALNALLADLEVIVIETRSGNEALSLTLEHDFALVMLDVQMPEMDGFETAELMRMNQLTRHVPIIFVTAISKEQSHIFRGYDNGAVDYIFKPLDPHIIRSKVTVFVDLYRQKQIVAAKNNELVKANQRILEQQEVLIKEERLKVLLQMAGAAAHELNQPLMVLLGNLELMDLYKEDMDMDKIRELIPRIQKAGGTISKTVKKIQNVRYDMTTVHDSKSEMIDLDPDI